MQFALRTAEGVWGTGSYAARFCELLRGFGFENPAGSVQFACELVNGFGSSQRLVAAVGCRPEQMGYWRFARMTELADVADLKSAALRGVQVQILLRAPIGRCLCGFAALLDIEIRCL